MQKYADKYKFEEANEIKEKIKILEIIRVNPLL